MFSVRRLAAIVLPQLACELARQQLAGGAVELSTQGGDAAKGSGLAVLYAEEPALSAAGTETAGAGNGPAGTSWVSAVDDKAAALGIRPGMRVSAAMARSANVRYVHLAPARLVQALGELAEVAMGFGTPVEVAFEDTLWVDVSGGAHLFGGETGLLEAMQQRIGQWLSAAGRSTRVEVGLADGAFHAQALARYSSIYPAVPRIAEEGASKSAIAPLPLSSLSRALSLQAIPDNEWVPAKELLVPTQASPLVETFARLGVFTLHDLMLIDRSQLSSRLVALLGAEPAELVMRWLQGYDPRPLIPFAPTVVLTDKMCFEDGVETAPQLVFAIRGMISRLSSRLTGRRQATNRIDIVLHYDKTMARFSAAEASARPSNWRVSNFIEDVTRVTLSVDLPAPLSSTEDLFRAIKAKVETLSLLAPCVAVDLSLSRLMEAPALQLDLSRASRVSPEALPALLSELSAELGAERVGMLTVEDDHRPERRSRLEWSNILSERRARVARRANTKAQANLTFSYPKPQEPSRLLPTPVALGSIGTASKSGNLGFLKSGGALAIESETFTIRSVQFDRRMDSVVWWTKVSPSRDYLRVELELPSHAKKSAGESAATILAWIYIDKKTGEAFLHGFWE